MMNDALMTLLQAAESLKQQLTKTPTQERLTARLLQFSDKEISKMPKTFRKEFRTQGCTAHVRKRTDARYICSYEIRYRRNGYNISVSARTLDEAKARFIEALHTAEKKQEAQSRVPRTFDEFANYYFGNFRWRKVAARTKKNDLGRYNRHIRPHFGSIPIKQITSAQCQELIDKLSDRAKTAHEVYSLLNVIFKMAIKHNIITHNPCDIVFIEPYEKEHGTALTKDEERKLLADSAGTPYQLMFAVALYTGLRPNEYKTARIEGRFIVAKNSKQKDRKREHEKRIPISPMLAPYISPDVELRFAYYDIITKHFKAILPNHILYDLRTTFNTRCQECGVTDVARQTFMGHSLGELDDAYTDLPDEYYIKEAAKIVY